MKQHGLALYLVLLFVISGCISTDADNTEWSASRSMSSPTLPVVSIAFSDDGGRVVTSHYQVYPINMRIQVLSKPDGKMQIWERQAFPDTFFNDDQPLASRTITDLSLQKLRFPPDSRNLQLVVRYNSSQLVKCDTDALRWSIDAMPLSVNAVSPDGTYSAGTESEDDSTISDTVILTDRETDTRRNLGSSSGEPHAVIEFSRDSKLLLTRIGGFLDDSVTFGIWETASGKQISQVLAHDVFGGYVRPSFSHDSKMFAYHAKPAPYEASVFRIYSVSNVELVRELVVNDNPIWAMAFSPDGKHFAVAGEKSDAGESGFVQVFHLPDGESVADISVKESWGVTAVSFTPDSESVAAGTADGGVLLFRLDVAPADAS